MSFDRERGPSSSQVDKAGSRMRKYFRGEMFDPDVIDRSLDLIRAWRSAHTQPLGTANMGLRSMVASEGCQVEVSQRLKRVPTILDKLTREPTLALSRMQDVGGVRAVLADVNEIARVADRVRGRRPVLNESDYIATPRESGYRGLHLIVGYRQRSIEIQLRTHVMHEWAITVERISGRLGTNLKQDGPHAIQDLMGAISEAMAIEEAGGIVSASLQGRIGELRSIAAPHLVSPWGG